MSTLSATRMNRPPATTGSPSKVALVLIEKSPLAMVGLDRMYMDCNRSGWAKFALFLFVFFLAPLLGPIFPIVALFYFAWLFMDWAIVTLNALSMSYFRPFCDRSSPSIGWTSKTDIRWAFWIALALGIFDIMFFVFLVSITITMGFDDAWNFVMSTLNVEEVMPNSEQMRGYAKTITG